MSKRVQAIFLILGIVSQAILYCQAWEYNGNRIAISADGNSAADNEYKWPTGDPDDWGASAASLAIIAKLKLQNQLVHYSYNNFIDAPAGPDDENQMKISCDGAIRWWKFNDKVFFDVTLDLENAKEHLAKEIAKSTPDDPLYLIHGGLSEFLYQAVELVVKNGNMESLSHLYLLSHSEFNEDEKRREWHRTWEDVQILSGNRIKYKKIQDQNDKHNPNHLWHSGSDFSVWHWMRDHSSESVRWLYSRMEVHSGGVADISDCGMLFYLLYGDDNGNPVKFKDFIGTGINENGYPCRNLSMNAIKDFDDLELCEFVPSYEDIGRDAVAINAAKYPDRFAAVQSVFQGVSGIYNIDLVSLTEEDGESTYKLYVTGKCIGTFQNPVAIEDMQTYTYTFKNILLNHGDTIQVQSNAVSNGVIPEGEGYAYSRGRWRQLDFSCVD